MANPLTGEFDVVAEFAIPAANRMLAAMHRIERFPHSWSLRVDDDPPPGSIVVRPSVAASVDTLGDPIADHTRIRTPAFTGQVSASNPIYSVLDSVVNPDVAGANVGPIVPSHLKGRAQLQFAAPTIEVPDASGTNIRVRMEIRSRYFPAPQTSALAEFIRGELALTAAVNQVTSEAARVVDVDIKADSVQISFSPGWSSQPVSAEDVAGVNQLIRNALKTSLLPSNNPLPSNINFMQFKSLLGGQSAIAVLLNMGNVRGDPGAFNNVFLGAGDDFAFAAGREFVLGAFQPIIDQILSQPLDPVKVDVPLLFYTYHATYTIKLNSATVDLQSGKIILTIQGSAATPTSWLPDFNFTVQQTLTLQVTGSTADFVLGEITLHTSSSIVNLFKGRALDGIKPARDQAIAQSNAHEKVQQMLSADANLGDFLHSLLNPATPNTETSEDLRPVLAYTSVEIGPSGIVLHGSMAVPDWPPVHAEFEEIPTTSGGGLLGTVGALPTGPDYSALKSWVPGGAVQRYEWSHPGQTQPYADENRFVMLHQGPVISDGTASAVAVSPYSPICLTVRGERLSSSGPVVKQSVSGSFCGYTSFPLPGGLKVGRNGELALVALTHPGPQGLVEVAGHTPATVAAPGNGAPNLLVHFADDTTAGSLAFLLDALRASKREDATTAVVAVLTSDQMKRAPYAKGIVYAEEHGRAWENVFGVKTRRPLTLIVLPNGEVAWQQEGSVQTGALAGALAKNLARGGSVRLGVLRTGMRIGHRPPNFLFEYSPGRELMLRKLEGRPATLVFWKSISRPSIEAVRDLQKTKPIVLAINDGDAPELARKSAAENGLSAILVGDPRREISRAYGVNIWPTIVILDASGSVRSIQYARTAGEAVKAPAGQKRAPEGH
jgi:hypothetical protein